MKNATTDKARQAINGQIKLTVNARRLLRMKLIESGEMKLAWMLDSIS